ncbi:hypothetical protein [Microbacterium indicum]|uniref:hypothetical protein n=1 Tax=Microbacterium indicum TaxID=358100 RepID=UPI00040BE96E|nr:hypothetical protein [Microbacterium indicum]
MITEAVPERLRAVPLTARLGDVVALGGVFVFFSVVTVVDLFVGVVPRRITAGEHVSVLNPVLWPVGLGLGLAGILAVAAIALAAWRAGGWSRRRAAAFAWVAMATSTVSAMALSAGVVINPAFVTAALPGLDHIALRLWGIAIGAAILLGGVAVAALPFMRLVSAERVR